jgi:putative DNA primase/helicase
MTDTENIVKLSQALQSGGAASEDAIALAFVTKHCHELRYVALWGRWMKYDGQCWRPDETLRVYDMVRELCREDYGRKAESAATIAAIEKLSRSDRRVAATIKQWDVDLYLLGTPDGTVDLRTGRLKLNDPGDYVTKITSIGPGGGCPLWLSFLRKIMDDDEEMVRFIQRMLGYCLTGVTSEHAMFFLYGTGANGKSVFITTVSGILVDYHTTAPITTFVQSQASDQHPTDLAGLRGARLVTAIETEEGRKWAENKIKSITGGDKISARFMRQDFFEFLPVFKLIIAGNNKPTLRTVDEAIRRRLHLVPFAVTIPEGERNKALADELKAEWPAILRWMIDGCLEWQRIGLAPPEAVRVATGDYFTDQDILAQWVEEQCDAEPGNEFKNEALAALYESWTVYIKKLGGEPGGRNSFSDRLVAKGFTRTRTKHGSIFRGIRLRPVQSYQGDAG